MVTLHSWMCLMFMAIMTINAHDASLVHKVFLPSDRSLNPFGDLFIQTVLDMDRKELSAITEMNGNEFLLLQLINNDDALKSVSSRDSDGDPYTSIFNDKLDDQLVLQDNIDSEWINLMTAGPFAVNCISNLLVLASKRDFPLSRSPTFVFQYIRDPNSFRATIAQVSGALYSALLGAHTAMDRIQLNVEQVPNQIKSALKLVLAGTPSLIKILLPKTLESISRIANESAAHAQVTFKNFVSLQELIAEIIEASVYTHSTHSDVVEQIKSQINESKHQEQQLNDNITLIKAQYEDARRQVEKARQEYQTALNAIPAIRRLMRGFFSSLWKGLVSIITAPLRILGCILGLCYSDRGLYEQAKQNAIEKAKLLRQVLQEAEQRYATFAQLQAVEQQKLMGVLQKLAGLDLDRMSEEEIVYILGNSTLQLNEIKVQWGRLIQFFSKLSVQADSTQQIVVHELINAIQDAQANDLLIEPTDREFFVEILSIVCQEIERDAHLLYIMSKTYYDISSEYMVDQIASMNILLLLQTDAERKAHLQTIASNATSVSQQIIQLAQERQNEYSSRNKARREEYENFLAKVAEEELDV